MFLHILDIATENVDVNEMSDIEEPDFSNRKYGKKFTGPWLLECVEKRKMVLLRQDTLL